MKSRRHRAIVKSELELEMYEKNKHWTVVFDSIGFKGIKKTIQR